VSHLLERCERALDAFALRLGDHAAQNLAEGRVLCTREDVLPAIGLEERGLDRLLLLPRDSAAAGGSEIIGIRGGLGDEDAVDRSDQFDEVVDRLVAGLIAQCRVVPLPFELVEDRVLAFLFPVEQEDVLEQGRQPPPVWMLSR